MRFPKQAVTDGTGFGLPLAVKIVEPEHGGRLSLESAKAQGTSVHILLPKHREAARGRAATLP